MPCQLWHALCENKHVTCKSCYPHIKHCPTCRAGLQQFTDVYGNQDQDCVSEICRHHKHGCRLRVAQDYDQHQCRFELLDYISPGAVELLFRIADIAFFSLAFGLEEPYCKVEASAELDELQHALGLSMKFLWERLL